MPVVGDVVVVPAERWHVVARGVRRDVGPPLERHAAPDLDLGEANLPPGTRLTIGSAVIEVTPEPHTGCGKFVERFGVDAMKFVNSPSGRALRLRGLNARVVQPGPIRVGDSVVKI